MLSLLTAFSKDILRNFKNRWRILIGAPSNFVLEARIFHSISLGLALLSAFYIPYNIFAGLYLSAVSCCCISAFFSYEYFRSRFRRLPHRTVIVGIIGLLILSVNYFSNSGLQGSTDLIWPVYLLMLLTICPYRQQLSWIIVYLLTFAFIHLIEYWFPQMVSYPFRVGEGQLLDRITAFPIPVIAIGLVIGMFRKVYDRERSTVEQRDLEKGKLLSILSHDLRAPFIQIQQYTELLEDPNLSATDQKQMAKVLRQTNHQTLELLTNILYWSRSQLSGSGPQLTAVNLSGTLENTLSIIQTLASQKGITVSQLIDSSISVTGDPDMLQMVVRNLLQNAVKFTPQGGKISISAQAKDSKCVLIVHDNGIGIDAARLDSLFSGKISPAYGTANEKGVGLGLLLCKEFVERQGGQISVESSLGKGTTFSVELPLAYI